MSQRIIQESPVKNPGNQQENKSYKVNSGKGPIFYPVLRYMRQVNYKDECYDQMKNRESFQPVFLYYLELIHKQSGYVGYNYLKDRVRYHSDNYRYHDNVIV